MQQRDVIFTALLPTRSLTVKIALIVHIQFFTTFTEGSVYFTGVLVSAN